VNAGCTCGRSLPCGTACSLELFSTGFSHALVSFSCEPVVDVGIERLLVVFLMIESRITVAANSTRAKILHSWEYPSPCVIGDMRYWAAGTDGRRGMSGKEQQCERRYE
jgi:hypothetical protein